MNKSRWFLAHSKQDDDNDIDAWCAELKETMSNGIWDAEVVAGRDDYKSRAAALGGWAAWCRDVSMGESYMGDPMFHGLIVPTSFEAMSIVGKATSQLIEGFLDRKKHVYAWCRHSKSFKCIHGIEPVQSDDWNSWMSLILAEES